MRAAVVDGPPAVVDVVVAVIVCNVLGFLYIALVCIVRLLFERQEMLPCGNVIDVAVVLVVLRLGPPRPAAVRLCPPDGGAAIGSGSSSGSTLGLDGGLFVLVCGLGLLEDVDYVFTLVASVSAMRREGDGYTWTRPELTLPMILPDLLMIVTVSVSCILTRWLGFGAFQSQNQAKKESGLETHKTSKL